MAANPTPRAATNAVPPRNDEIDLRTFVGVLSDHKWLILIGTGLFFLAASLYVLLATPKYEASAVVQVQSMPSPVPGINPEGGAQAIAVTEARSATEIPLLGSRQVLGEAVRNLGLDVEVKPMRLPVLGNFMARRHDGTNPDALASPWLGLSGFGWGGERLEIGRFEVPAELLSQPLKLVAGEGGRWTLFADGRELLSGRAGQTATGNGVTLQVTRLQANPGMRFEVRRHDPLAVMEQLKKDIEVSEQGRESGVITLRYSHPDPVVAQQVIAQVSNSYVRQNQMRFSAEAAKRLDFVRKQLPKVEAELARAQKALSDYQTRTRTLDVAAQHQALLSQSLALDSSIAQLRVQEAEVAGRYTNLHPQRRSINEQIARFQRQKAALESRIAALPDTQEGLFRLTRDLEVINRTYANLLDQAQQLDIARASAVGTARVIDPAAVRADQPSSPRAVPVLAGATAAGALLMVAFVLLRYSLRRAVEDPADVEALGVPVYASIPYSPKARAAMARPKGQANLLALNAPNDMAMEALRGLRTNLLLSRLHGGSNLLMIAAPSPGVGKTFVCANLAASIALTGQRVLLIDADMRRGTLHDALGTRSEGGLAELLAGKLSVEEALRTAPGLENLHFLSRGAAPPNPSELLMHPNFQRVLKELAPRFDMVLIDTPPVLAVTDATVIGHHVGTSLMVVRYGLSEQREVATAIRRLEQNGVEVAGAIFNAVENRLSGRYAYTHYEYAPEVETSRRGGFLSGRGGRRTAPARRAH
ncbi:MAG: polysaccharide biosynthesis tyrosine autokinase [Pseudomonadota bacterium]